MSAKKKATAKKNAGKPSVKKKAVKKKAVKKKAVKKKAVKKRAVKKRAATRKASSGKKDDRAQKRYKMIQDAAYYLAEKSGFAGSAVDHWIRAEKQIDAQLKSK